MKGTCRLLLVVMLMTTLVVGFSVSRPAVAQEPVTITWWDIHSEEPGGTMMRGALERFEANHPEAKVELTFFENDPFKTKLSVAMSAGDPPDVFMTWGGGVLKEYVEAGMVRDLTPEMEAGWKDNFSEGGLRPLTFDGKIYGAPLDLSAVFVWYNKAIFAEYDLEPPATFEEWKEVIATLKEAGITPISLGNKDKWQGAFYLIYLADRIGGPEAFLNAYNRAPGGTFEDPVFIEAGEKIQELVEMGAFPEGFNGLSQTDEVMIFASEQAAMHVMGNWVAPQVNERNPAMLEEDELGLFPFPAVEGGKGDPSNLVGGANIAFAVSSKAPDLAVELVKELTSKETATFLASEMKRLPAVVGVEDAVEDPRLQEVAKYISAAKGLQLYYDQFLPPDLGEVHKDTTQELFGLTMTPEEAAEAMEKAAEKSIGPAVPAE
jgi:raffinose/stachyose/melibiose transport system substrate-binding protein